MNGQFFLKILAGISVFILGLVTLVAGMRLKITKNTISGLKGRLIASGIMAMMAALIYLLSLL